MWGVQWSALGIDGSGAPPSSLRDEAEIARVLQTHATAVAWGDTAALAHATGILVEPRHLEELNARIFQRARAQATPNQHGAPEVWDRLRSGASGAAPKTLPDEPWLYHYHYHYRSDHTRLRYRVLF
jgi:hypothetical protein